MQRRSSIGRAASSGQSGRGRHVGRNALGVELGIEGLGVDVLRGQADPVATAEPEAEPVAGAIEVRQAGGRGAGLEVGVAELAARAGYVATAGLLAANGRWRPADELRLGWLVLAEIRA